MEKRPEKLLEAYKNAYPYLRVAEGSGVPEERLDLLEEKLESREDIIMQLLENGKHKEKEIKTAQTGPWNPRRTNQGPRRTSKQPNKETRTLTGKDLGIDRSMEPVV